MEIYNQQKDLEVFGIPVKTFPKGIAEAFGALMKILPGGNNRAYYGLTKAGAGGAMLYWATAEEQYPGEAEKYDFESHCINKGIYLAQTVMDWKKKTDSIKNVFHEIMQDEQVDKTKPCVEWYKNEKEMVCMMQLKPAPAILESINEAATELLDLLSAIDEQGINALPFKDGWSAAQLASHITKSNKAMSQAMEMEGKPTDRDPIARTAELRDTFLDFSVKFKSPAFILPAPGQYEKQSLLASLKKSNERLKENAAKTNTREMIYLPAFGEITKLELLYFVLYHTQRHIRQLKNIIQQL